MEVLNKLFLQKLSIIFKNTNKYVDREYLEELIREMIEESRLLPNKPLNIVEQYTVDDNITIYINNRNGILEYIVVEPSYDEETIYAVSEIYLKNPNCRNIICIEKTVADKCDHDVQEIYSRQPLNINYYYMKISSGYGALYPLIRDELIEEIAASSSDKYVSIIHRRYGWYGWMNTNIELKPGSVDRIVLSIARMIGKHLSITHPVAEGLSREGLRVSLTYGYEVSRKGSSLVIRKKPSSPWTITRLIDNKVLSSLIAAYLWLVMEFRGSILIVGGVSSGKTTLLQALLTLIPPTRRVVTIEDTPEITGSTGYWDPLVERTVSVGESLNIDMYSLLRFSLRRRADYLVVGEVRGVEARLLIQASRLGHGVLTTMHAEDAASVIERLYSPPISIPKNLLSNIWVIVVMENEHGIRRVKTVYEVDRKIRLHEIFRYGGKKFIPNDPGIVAEKTIRLRNILDKDVLLNELLSRMNLLDQMVSNGVFELDRISEELVNYYYESFLEEVISNAM